MMNTWGLVKTINYSGESWSDDEYLEMVDEMMNTWSWAETFNYSGESWSHDEYLEMVAEYLNTWIFEVRWKHLIILEKAEAMMNT